MFPSSLFVSVGSENELTYVHMPRVTGVEACGETRFAAVFIHPNLSPKHTSAVQDIHTPKPHWLKEGACRSVKALPSSLILLVNPGSFNYGEHTERMRSCPTPVDQDATIAASLT